MNSLAITGLGNGCSIQLSYGVIRFELTDYIPLLSFQSIRFPGTSRGNLGESLVSYLPINLASTKFINLNLAFILSNSSFPINDIEVQEAMYGRTN